MKKLLSLMMALVIALTTLLAIPATAQAAQKYNNNVINANVDYIKNYIKNNGFLNGNGEYTLQDSGTFSTLRYYGLFLLDPGRNILTLDYQLCDIDSDDIYSATTLEIPYADTDIMETDISYWVFSTNYSDLNGYAYIDKNFNHNTQTPVFYISSNSTYYSDYDAKEMCGDMLYLAFDEWEYMMEDFFGMNLSVLGFHSYCTGHIYGYDGDSCVYCGAYNTKTAKPKATKISKLTAGKKQFKATWKKVSGVTGYQIQYSTNKSFKKGNKTVTVKGAKKTSAAVKKLKSKKKYYVRIRTYKTVNGKKVYSSWSSAKTIKTK